MKKTSLILALLATTTLGLSSCANWADRNLVSNRALGSVGESITGTVVSARMVRADASSTDKNLGTGIGAAVGAGAGSLLGGGSGQIASAVGFGIVGAMVGRGVSKYANQSDAQELSIQADANGKTYTVTQPVYKEFGPIAPGTRGTLTLSSGNSVFTPEGY